MATPSSRSELRVADYCTRQLGTPVLEFIIADGRHLRDEGVPAKRFRAADVVHPARERRIRDEPPQR